MSASNVLAPATTTLVKQETPVSFYPMTSSPWDCMYPPISEEVDVTSSQPDFTDAIWDVPLLGIESPSSIAPGLAYQSSHEEQHPSLSRSVQPENGWGDAVSPTSRSTSQECEDNTKREKRRQQNRRAQQAYRMRKDQQISCMEKELLLLREAYKNLKGEHQQLLGQLTAVKDALA